MRLQFDRSVQIDVALMPAQRSWQKENVDDGVWKRWQTFTRRFGGNCSDQNVVKVIVGAAPSRLKCTT